MAIKKSLTTKTLLTDISKNKTIFFMLLPAVLYYLIFAYIPMVGSILAFKSYNYVDGIFGSPWIGLENFRFLFLGGKIYNVAFNTIAFNIVFLITGQFLEILFSILLAELGSRHFKKLAQSAMIMPYFLSWIIIRAFMSNIFNYEFGALNTLFRAISLEAVDVYGNVGVWKYILVAVNAWKWVGYGAVIYLAAIAGIGSEYYEAATIDGAGKFKKTIYITIPFITPQIIILILLSIGNIFRGDFQMFYHITANNPLLYNATDVIDTFVVRALLQLQDVGMASAAGLSQSVICFVILLLSNALVRKYQRDYALF